MRVRRGCGPGDRGRRDDVVARGDVGDDLVVLAVPGEPRRRGRREDRSADREPRQTAWGAAIAKLRARRLGASSPSRRRRGSAGRGGRSMRRCGARRRRCRRAASPVGANAGSIDRVESAPDGLVVARPLARRDHLDQQLAVSVDEARRLSAGAARAAPAFIAASSRDGTGPGTGDVLGRPVAQRQREVGPALERERARPGRSTGRRPSRRPQWHRSTSRRSGRRR